MVTFSIILIFIIVIIELSIAAFSMIMLAWSHLSIFALSMVKDSVWPFFLISVLLLLFYTIIWGQGLHVHTYVCERERVRTSEREREYIWVCIFMYTCVESWQMWIFFSFFFFCHLFPVPDSPARRPFSSWRNLWNGIPYQAHPGKVSNKNYGVSRLPTRYWFED